MPDEALVSWLCRLASKIGLSPLAFIRHAFGIDSHHDAQWWRRPGAEQLARIAAGTGISLKQLEAMTLAGWFQARQDEQQERFSTQYALHSPGRHATDRFIAACLHCLAEGNVAYVRRDWMLGWQAACAHHQCRLVHRCPACRAELRLANLGSRDVIVMDRCRRCGTRWHQPDAPAVSPVVIGWQSQLLKLKRQGITVLPSLGRIDWATFMVIADLVAAALWPGEVDHHREQLFERILLDLDMPASDRLLIEWSSNEGMLLTLAWLMADWPNRLEQMLEALHAPAVEALLDRLIEVDGGMRERLRDLLGSARRYRQQDVGERHWREWLRRLVASGTDFRALARREPHQGYSERLEVFAMLAEGRSIEETAIWVKLKSTTIQRWIEVALAYGIHMVIEKPARVCDLTPEQAREIRQWLRSTPWLLSPRTGGRADHVRVEIARQFGLNVSVSAAQRLLPTASPYTPILSLPDHAESRN